MSIISRTLRSIGGALTITVADGDTLEVRISRVGGVTPFSVKPLAGSATIKAAVITELVEVVGSPVTVSLQDVLEAGVSLFTVAASGGAVEVEMIKVP